MTSSTSKSKNSYEEAYVWTWLPDEVEPVVAGLLTQNSGEIRFNYGKSYLERTALNQPGPSIYEPELPLQYGILPLLGNLTMPSCIRDASPDAWGRRVIVNKLLGIKGKATDTAVLGEMVYLLESGSDRIGALDFQQSPTEYVPRSPSNASMEELLAAVQFVEEGKLLTPELSQALLHGSSVGGARPKALIQDQNKKYIVKFSRNSDLYDMVKAEFIAMRLAELVGLNVAPVKLVRTAGKDMLLIERFDRKPADKNGLFWSRRAMVSGLTILGLHELEARYASYQILAENIRKRFSAPKDTLKELFSRLVFNILCGNTDDHARNHAAFWDGRELSLTPAYDICPQNRSGNEVSQAMLIVDSNNLSQLKTCLLAAHHFLLSENEAKLIFDHQEATIRQHWDSVCDAAKLTALERKLFWQRQFLNPFSMER